MKKSIHNFFPYSFPKNEMKNQIRSEITKILLLVFFTMSKGVLVLQNSKRIYILLNLSRIILWNFYIIFTKLFPQNIQSCCLFWSSKSGSLYKLLTYFCYYYWTLWLGLTDAVLKVSWSVVVPRLSFIFGRVGAPNGGTDQSTHTSVFCDRDETPAHLNRTQA